MPPIVLGRLASPREPCQLSAFSEIGNGVLDWKRILAAAEKAGTEWLIVEQDTCPGDPFDSIKISFDYLQALLKA